VKLAEIIERLGLNLVAGRERTEVEVTGGYAGDLLSDVIANGKAGDVWVTIQVHPNIVAVAILKDFSAIIIPNGRQPQEETLKKAREEGTALATSTLPTFELVGRLYEMGLSRSD